MTAVKCKVRSPLKWHGGKYYLARRIIALMPEHRCYIEPFLGSGSVLLNKTKTEREVAGDLNENLIGFWQCLATRHHQMIPYIADIPYSDAFFGWAIERCAQSVIPESVPDATAFMVRNRMSRGGLGKDFAWSERLRGKRRPGGPVPGELNAWDTIRAELPAIAERIRDVEFHCCDALNLIRENDGPDTLIYCDPPYLHETRTHTKAYDHEMTREQHAELLGVLLSCRSKVFLSGYANPLYDAVLRDWKRTDFLMPNHSGQGKTKQRRIECLWENNP